MLFIRAYIWGKRGGHLTLNSSSSVSFDTITRFFSLHTRHESQSKPWSLGTTVHIPAEKPTEPHEFSLKSAWIPHERGVAKHGQYRTGGLACIFRQGSILFTRRSHSDHFYISTVGTTSAIEAASLSKYRGIEGRQVSLLLLNKPTTVISQRVRWKK